MDEAALLAAIEAAPDDDAPRLVLADWLQQRGDPWGEIIVLGCELARRNDPALRERYDALVAQRFADPRMGQIFERGFCAIVFSRELASAVGPEYAVLREAEHDGATIASVRALATWPPLARLERLELRAERSGTEIGRELPAIVAVAKRLRTLELTEMDVTRADLVAMFAVPHVAQLARLEISANESLRNSLANLAWPALAELDLGACDLYGDGVAELLAGERLRGLRALSLSYNEISDDGAGALADHPFSELAALDLVGNDITPRGLALLASSQHLRGLRSLTLGGGYDIDIDRGLATLATAFPALETLRIVTNYPLPSLPALARPLHELRLALSALEPAALAAMLASPPARALRSLEFSLRHKEGGDELAQVIAAAELPALERLWFRIPIGPAGVAAFARAPHLPARCYMMLKTTADVAALRARYVRVVI